MTRNTLRLGYYPRDPVNPRLILATDQGPLFCEVVVPVLSCLVLK